MRLGGRLQFIIDGFFLSVLQETGVYQHVGADRKCDGDAVAWDAADSSAPLQPPRPEGDTEEGEEEVSMDTTPPGNSNQEVSCT